MSLAHFVVYTAVAMSAFYVVTFLYFLFGYQASDLWRWCRNIWVAVDQWVNAITGGDPDVTISARMGKAMKEGRCVLCRPICALLTKFFKEPTDHCISAAESPTNRGNAHDIFQK